MTSPPPPKPEEIRDELIARREQRHSTLRRILLAIAGTLLIIAGLALGPVPVLPGFPLTMLGLILLASASESMRRLVNWGDAKLPQWLRRFMRKFRRHSH